MQRATSAAVASSKKLPRSWFQAEHDISAIEAGVSANHPASDTLNATTNLGIMFSSFSHRPPPDVPRQLPPIPTIPSGAWFARTLELTMRQHGRKDTRLRLGNRLRGAFGRAWEWASPTRGQSLQLAGGSRARLARGGRRPRGNGGRAPGVLRPFSPVSASRRSGDRRPASPSRRVRGRS